jgi:hypothetical protein
MSENNITANDIAIIRTIVQKTVDSNVISVCDSYMARMEQGIKKYGVSTERTDIDLVGWLQHLQEELMDATIYIEAAKNQLKKVGQNVRQ